MVNWKERFGHLSCRTRTAGAAVAALALGAAAGAGAVGMTRPSIEMAPTASTAIARISEARGIVTVRGQVLEIYGNSFILQDNSGRTLIDAGPTAASTVSVGDVMLVQGHYDEGRLRASFLVDPQGRIEAVDGPPRPHGPRGHGPGGPDPAAPLQPPPAPTMGRQGASAPSPAALSTPSDAVVPYAEPTPSATPSTAEAASPNR